MRSLALAPALVLCFALPFSVACRPAEGANENATTYRITGVLAESGCSPGLDPIDPLVYDVAVRSTGPVVYWRLGRNPWIPGSIAADGTFRISTRSAIEAISPYRGTDPDFDPPRAGCTLLQTETILGRFVEPDETDAGSSDAATTSLDAGVPDANDGGSADAYTELDGSPASDAGDAGDAGPPDPTAIGAIEGENIIELSIAPGSDCTPLLSMSGGAFPSLPCTARYDLVGAARD